MLMVSCCPQAAQGAAQHPNQGLHGWWQSAAALAAGRGPGGHQARPSEVRPRLQQGHLLHVLHLRVIYSAHCAQHCRCSHSGSAEQPAPHQRRAVQLGRQLLQHWHAGGPAGGSHGPAGCVWGPQVRRCLFAPASHYSMDTILYTGIALWKELKLARGTMLHMC
jgi:hypothetical protein